ncbi:MAG: hypothetical protein EOO77_05130 [Oxalobacteraceae bacterium]|nr:MAG: hypothetical protein EOO77_05130 [Oxalobacteraceae bacterium]
MSYTVKFMKVSGTRVVHDEVYDDLPKALTETVLNANFPFPIVVTVTGDDGVEYYSNRSE